jgi:hypothetical protein
MAHSKEPWRVPVDNEGRRATWIVSSEDDGTVEYMYPETRKFYQGELVAESMSADDARRIVACVNFCAGITTDELEALLADGWTALKKGREL